ncbi:MAG TPA: P-loop NTPase [Acidimicrobiales bacterium]|jgi:Mrp family chromosome partitioning ATPase|nr:P-loop NTPase [Acidimicrobiales bacterium]
MRVIAKRWLVIVVTVLMAAAVAVAAAMAQTTRFRATAAVSITPSGVAALLDPGAQPSAGAPGQSSPSETALVDSPAVRSRVRAQLGSAPPVSATLRPGGQVLAISAEDSNAGHAARVATTYAEAVVNYRQAQDRGAISAAESQLQAQISGLATQIQALANQAPSAGPGAPALGIQMAQLTQQQGALTSELARLRSQGPGAAQNARLLAPATTPSAPVSPRPVHDAVLASLLGLVLGVAAAWGLELLDGTVTSRRDLAPLLAGTPTLAALPHVAAWTDVGPFDLASVDASASAYRQLAAAVLAQGTERDIRTVLITGPSGGEGRSTVVAHLGIALAQVLPRVVVVDDDPRGAGLHEFFGLGDAPGLTSVLNGETPIFAALQAVPYQPNLSLLAAGPVKAKVQQPPAAGRAAELLAAVGGQSDVALLDSPPILSDAIPALPIHLVDGVLLVVAAGKTSRSDLRRSLQALRRADASLLGVVLNDVAAAAATPEPPPPSRQPPRGPSRGIMLEWTKALKQKASSQP